MFDQIRESLSGALNFAATFGSSLGLLALFILIYAVITPYKEFSLIREGKTAPLLSFGGAVLGFVIPLGSAVAHSVGFVDMLVWSVVALVTQLLVFFVASLIFRNLSEAIQADRISMGGLLGVLSTAVGILNAASLTY